MSESAYTRTRKTAIFKPDRPGPVCRLDLKLVHAVHVAARDYGISNDEIAEMCGVSVAMIQRWLQQGREHLVAGWEHTIYAQFLLAIKSGHDEFNTDVAEKALLQRVKGFNYDEIRKETVEITVKSLREKGIELPPDIPDDAICTGTKTITTTRKVIPDVTAIVFFLQNRAGHRWKNVSRQEHVIQGNVDHRHLHGFVGGVAPARNQLDVTKLSTVELEQLGALLGKLDPGAQKLLEAEASAPVKAEVVTEDGEADPAAE